MIMAMGGYGGAWRRGERARIQQYLYTFEATDRIKLFYLFLCIFRVALVLCFALRNGIMTELEKNNNN